MLYLLWESIWISSVGTCELTFFYICVSVLFCTLGRVLWSSSLIGSSRTPVVYSGVSLLLHPPPVTTRNAQPLKTTSILTKRYYHSLTHLLLHSFFTHLLTHTEKADMNSISVARHLVAAIRDTLAIEIPTYSKRLCLGGVLHALNLTNAQLICSLSFADQYLVSELVTSWKKKLLSIKSCGKMHLHLTDKHAFGDWLVKRVKFNWAFKCAC